MSAPWWQHQLKQLSDRFRCIAYDPRSYGRSEKVNHGHRMSRHARDLYDVMGALDLEGAVVCGWSTGGATVLAYSELFRDEHLAGMVIVDQSPCNVTRPGWRWGFGNRKEANAFLRAIRADHRAAAEELVDAMFHQPLSASDREWMINEIIKTPASAAAELERDDMNQDWRDVLAQVPLPTLVMVGKHSQIFPNQACIYLADHLPEGRLVVFENSGHCPFIEERDSFNEVLSDFASSVMR